MRKLLGFNFFLQSLLLLSAIIPNLALASVTYVFNVTNYPDGPFHLPFYAELVFTDSAVAAGVAYSSDIESLNISAGHTIPEFGLLTMDYLHPAFIDVQFNFSADKEVIVSVFARISPSMQNRDHLALTRSRPPPPEFDIHEQNVRLAHDYIVIETYLTSRIFDPDISTFRGEWQHKYESFIIEPMRKYFACFPYCPIPWIIILLVAAAITAGFYLRRKG